MPATQNFYIPTFIASFIEDSVLYSALAGAAVLILLLIGIMTDNVTQAVEMAKGLEKRSDVDRMVDKIKTVL